MRMNPFLAAGAGLLIAASPTQADQRLSPGSTNDFDNVVLPGGPTLGLWSGGTSTSAANALQTRGAAPISDVAEVGATPGVNEATRTLANLLAKRLPLTGGTLTGPLTLPRVQIGPASSPTGYDPIYSINSESATPGVGAFGPSHVFIINRQPGSNGNRESIHVEMNSSGGATGDQIVGGMLAGRIVGGSGTAYGSNPYCWVDVAADGHSQCIGEETDTDARRDVAAKVGIQVVDVATSIGKGTAIEAAYLAARQPGGSGFGTGLQFGYIGSSQADRDARYPVRSGGAIIYSLPTTIKMRTGIDFSAIETPFTDAAIKLAPGNTVSFGQNGSGGTLRSATDNGAGSVIFGSGITIVDFGGRQQHRFTPNSFTTSVPIIEAMPSTPASSTAACTTGQRAWDQNYEYRCVATDTWKRAALAAF